jgi:hypothetical protein
MVPDQALETKPIPEPESDQTLPMAKPNTLTIWGTMNQYVVYQMMKQSPQPPFPPQPEQPYQDLCLGQIHPNGLSNQDHQQIQPVK